MELPLTPDQEARLSQIASYHGKDVTQLVQETVVRLLDDDVRFREAVERGIDQADRGELLEHDEVVERIERMFRS